MAGIALREIGDLFQELQLVWGMIASRVPPAAQELRREIIEDTDKFVPYDTGHLSKSVEDYTGTSYDSAGYSSTTSLGIVYTADYAEYVAHMPEYYDFNRKVHPDATPKWTSMSIKLNKAKWLENFRRRVLNG